MMFPKDPDETDWFAIDWTSRLAEVGDTITGSTWTVPGGITSVSTSFTNNTTSIRLSGGTIGTNYKLTNRITTATRTLDESFTVKIKER